MPWRTGDAPGPELQRQNAMPDPDPVPEYTNHIVVAGDVLVDHHIYEGERMQAGQNRHRGLKCTRETGGAALIPRLLSAVQSAAAKDRERRLKLAQDAVAQHTSAQAEAQDASSRAIADKNLKTAGKELEKISQREADGAGWSCRLGITVPNQDALPCGHHALATWKPFPLDPKDRKNRSKAWRASLLMGYGHDEQSADLEEDSPACCNAHTPEPLPDLPTRPRILVLDDGGFIFRHRTQSRCWLLPAREVKDSAPEWLLLKASAPVA